MSTLGKGKLVYRQRFATRLTHWVWVVCLFFLLLSGLQIFMARPDLYIGHQSGFQFDNSILSIGAVQTPSGTLRGVTELLGTPYDTTGWLGVIEADGVARAQTFPQWLVIPSYRDLASGRVVHFFFAWILVVALAVWLVAGLLNRHVGRDIVPGRDDIRALPRDVADHARFRFRHGARYGPLQKLSYFVVLFLLLPLMIATGLTMSPGMNAYLPWLVDLFGGRQSARTLHFAVMLLLVAFFVIHVAMVILAGPINEMRSMITGWFRTDAEETPR